MIQTTHSHKHWTDKGGHVSSTRTPSGTAAGRSAVHGVSAEPDNDESGYTTLIDS